MEIITCDLSRLRNRDLGRSGRFFIDDRETVLIGLTEVVFQFAARLRASPGHCRLFRPRIKRKIEEQKCRCQGHIFFRHFASGAIVAQLSVRAKTDTLSANFSTNVNPTQISEDLF
jgi:hypothetical protein